MITMTRPSLTPEQFAAPLYAVLAEISGREVTARVVVRKDDHEFFAPMIVDGEPYFARLYDRPEGGDQLAQSEPWDGQPVWLPAGTMFHVRLTRRPEG